ncbi:MAG: universal stress protein [Firmicutes bacterium]|nr:universal stress protein [Bacillota bacterium]
MTVPTFTRVLAPLDGSELAERGLGYAVRLARALGVGLVLIRVVANRRQAPGARSYLQAAARAAAAGLEAGIEVRCGDPVHEILAAERDGDLIVMTSHGATGLERFLLGSVADRVLRYGRAPVFLARAFQPPAAVLSPILVPLDGSQQAEAMLPYATLLARMLGAELKLLRVIHVRAFDAVAYPPQIVEMTLEWERAEGRRYIERLVQALAAEGLRVRGSVREDEPFRAIVEAAGEEEGGFIAMATHARTGLVRTLLGSVAASVAEHAPDPVLLLKV